jgi:hypothetical protein
MEPLRPEDPVYVGSYRLEGRLGAGGMGQVYLASSPGGLKVAVKVIRSEHARDPQFRARFIREIEAARRVGGFHTAQIVDADAEADPPWMATAYIAGPSLQELVHSGGPLSPSRTRAVGAALAEGLMAIHARGLVHRDLKPGNVIVAPDGARIVDFGIARIIGASSLTSTGVAVGTFSFMSPEQMNARPAGPASDVFSLGAVLAFAATGRGPFDAENIPAIVNRVVNGTPDLGDIDGDLRAVISACLAREPADRLSASDVLARLGTVSPRASRSMPPLAEPAGAASVETSVRAPTPKIPSPDADGSEGGTRGRGVSRRTLVTAAVGCAAGAGAGIPVALLASGPGPARSPGNAIAATRSPRRAAAVTSLHSSGTSANAAAFSRDGKLLAVGCSTSNGSVGIGDGFAQVWHMPSGSSLATIPGQGNVASVAFSPNGKTLAIGSELGYLQLWDIAAKRVTANYNMAGLLGTGTASMAFSPDGATLVACTDDGDCNGVIQFWKLPDASSPGSHDTVSGHACHADAGLTSVAFIGNGTVISGGVDHTIRIWDMPSRRNTATWPAGGPVQALALSPDAKTLVSGSQPASGARLQFWNVPSGTIRAAPALGGGRTVLSLAWSPDGKHVVSGCKDNTVQVWDAATFTHKSSVTVPFTYGVQSVAFTPDGTAYVVCGAEGAQATILLTQVT